MFRASSFLPGVANRTLRRTLIALVAIALTAGGAKAADYLIGRVPAHSRITRSVWVGLNDNYVVLVGDHSTDLDCWLRNPSGVIVASDTDPSDVCILPAPGYGLHQIDIQNLGGVYNDFQVFTTEFLP